MTKRKNGSKKIDTKPKLDMCLPAPKVKEELEGQLKNLNSGLENYSRDLDLTALEIAHRMEENLAKIEEINNSTISNFSTKDDSSTIVETLEFSDSKNSLKVHLVKKPNRLFSLQILMNDQTEIRPVTYSGASMAYAYWNLLKGSMKK